MRTDRLPDDVATTAHFVASEAGVTNAVKHAEANRIDLHVTHADGGLTLCIRDDGLGGASMRGGTGLTGMVDRVAAAGLLRAVDDHHPDLAIIDVRMPPDLTDDGARAAKEVRNRYPELGIVLLSQHIGTRHSVELVAGGRFGYLLKDRSGTCSRTASWTSTTSSTRSAVSPAADPRSTRKWSCG
ncbi:MAG TPA: response regulator [Nakamurella sp.]